MRIGVDIRGILSGGKSGVEQYTIEILKALLAVDKKNTYVFFYFSYKELDQRFNKLLEEHPEFKQSNVQVVAKKWINFPLLLHATMKPLNWPKIDQLCGGLDVMFMPFPMLLPLTDKCAKVTTFHDLVIMLFPQFFNLYSRIWQWQMSYPYEARTSDQIIAVSKNTKRDLINLISADPGKTKVIYEGINPEFLKDHSKKFKEVREKYNLPEKFIYFVGNVEPRKNLITLVRALHHLKKTKSKSNIKLVVSGGKSWLSSDLYAEIDRLNLKDDITFTGYVSEEDKMVLFQMARMFVFPSVYEGFGLMIFEAFAANCPVIVSNNSSLPEIGGEGVLKFSTFDYNELAEKIKELDKNTALREKLIKAGRERANQYSWEVAAEETLKVFEEAHLSHEK